MNDPGGSVDGTGGANAAADAVVAKIKAAGGEAVASYASVAEEKAAQSIIATAMDTWGRPRHPGQQRRHPARQGLQQHDHGGTTNSSNQVHHFGTVYCTKAAWPIMRKQSYGRIVVTTSGSGTVGNFGQANYGAAKMAVNGLINVLRHEGAKYNIRLNAISPSAYTRMTESLLPPRHRPVDEAGNWSPPSSPGSAARNATRTARSWPPPPAVTQGCSISLPRASSFDPRRTRHHRDGA